jgi:anti-sigma regulatory factor (Ser/Thr protein kinase)
MTGPLSERSSTDLGEALAFPLSGGTEAAAAARRAVVAGDGALPVAVRQDVLLLVTELVNNAVRHAAVGPEQSLRVELRLWPRRVRVEVVDPGTGFTQIRARRPPSEPGGWGLFLVERIADRWGVAREGSGTCVWFEIEYEG